MCRELVSLEQSNHRAEQEATRSHRQGGGRAGGRVGLCRALAVTLRDVGAVAGFEQRVV